MNEKIKELAILARQEVEHKLKDPERLQINIKENNEHIKTN
jgi:hypothetical protein